MKRSEALNIIMDARHKMELEGLIDSIDEEILTSLEKAGMLPPYNPIGSEPMEGHIMYCQWSKEDE